MFSYDFLISVVVFLTFIVLFNFAWSYLDAQTFEKIEFNEMQEVSAFVSDVLVRSAGNPSNWNETNHAMIGLAKKENVIDFDRLAVFSRLNYSEAQLAMTVYPYYFSISLTPVNWSSPLFCYPNLQPLAYHTWTTNDSVAVFANSTLVSKFAANDINAEAYAYTFAFRVKKQGNPAADLNIYLETSQTSSPTNLLAAVAAANVSTSYSTKITSFSQSGNDSYFYFSCLGCSASDNYILAQDGNRVVNTYLWNSTAWVAPRATVLDWVSYNLTDYCAPQKLPQTVSSLVPASRYVLLDYNNGTRVPSIFQLVIWNE